MSEEKARRIFHRTAEGTRACESRLPEAHRAVLRSVGEATHFDAIVARLAHEQPIEELVRCLDDLEAIGLIESLPLEWLVELCTLELCALELCARAPVLSARQSRR